MSDLVIGSLSHKLELKPCGISQEINNNSLKCRNNIQILNYKWVETCYSNERIKSESIQHNTTELESSNDKYINRYDEIYNKSMIPFNLLYPDVFKEVSELICRDGAIGCLIISEPDYLVEEFCIFLTNISKYNYKIDLSKYIHSDIKSTYMHNTHDISGQLSKLTIKSQNNNNAEYSGEDVTSKISKQLNFYISHLPKCNIINLLSVIKSKHVYTFEDNLLLITIHAIYIALINKYNINKDELNKVFDKLNVKEYGNTEESDTKVELIDKSVTITLINVCTFAVAYEIDDKYFHIHQMMDLLIIYMKAWKELNLPIKFIIPFEKLQNNPINLLVSSDLIVKFFRLPFPLMKWQRQVLFEWKLDINSNSSKLLELIDISNGLNIAEILNLPIMRGWNPIEKSDESVLKSDNNFDYISSINNLLPIESHIVVGISGMGKTNYAINLARKLQVPFVRFSVTEYLRPEIGLSEMEISKFFKSLYKYSSGNISSVLLMEYIDSVNMYNITSIVSRELNNLLSNNYWNSKHRILIIVTLMGSIDNLKHYPMIKNFKVIKLDPLNLEKATSLLTQMLNETFNNSEDIIESWKRIQDKNSVFTISQIKDIVESTKMKSFTRLLEGGNVDKLTLILEDLIE